MQESCPTKEERKNRIHPTRSYQEMAHLQDQGDLSFLKETAELSFEQNRRSLKVLAP